MLYSKSFQGQIFKASICPVLSPQLIIHNELFCQQAQLSTGDKSLYQAAIFHFLWLCFPSWHPLIGYMFATDMNESCIASLSFLQICPTNYTMNFRFLLLLNYILSTDPDKQSLPAQANIVGIYCATRQLANSRAQITYIFFFKCTGLLSSEERILEKAGRWGRRVTLVFFRERLEVDFQQMQGSYWGLKFLSKEMEMARW